MQSFKEYIKEDYNISGKEAVIIAKQYFMGQDVPLNLYDYIFSAPHSYALDIIHHHISQKRMIPHNMFNTIKKYKNLSEYLVNQMKEYFNKEQIEDTIKQYPELLEYFI